MPRLVASTAGIYADRLIRALPAAMPHDAVIAWYLHAKGLFRSRRYFSDGAARPNLTEHASRFPARVFQPLSFRAGVPRLEWLVRFDVLLATNFLPPPTSRPCVVLAVHDCPVPVIRLSLAPISDIINS